MHRAITVAIVVGVKLNLQVINEQSLVNHAQYLSLLILTTLLKSSVLNQELAKKVVHGEIYWSECYHNFLKRGSLPDSFDKATNSFQSLCTKYNMNEGEFLILKKKA